MQLGSTQRRTTNERRCARKDTPKRVKKEKLPSRSTSTQKATTQRQRVYEKKRTRKKKEDNTPRERSNKKKRAGKKQEKEGQLKKAIITEYNH